jgi:hypothetical protein
MIRTLAALILALLCIYFGAIVSTIVILCGQIRKEESGPHAEQRYRGQKSVSSPR